MHTIIAAVSHVRMNMIASVTDLAPGQARRRGVVVQRAAAGGAARGDAAGAPSGSHDGPRWAAINSCERREGQTQRLN